MVIPIQDVMFTHCNISTSTLHNNYTFITPNKDINRLLTSMVVKLSNIQIAVSI